MRARLPRRGFTLLEVLVAVAILGLGLTTILSAQTGLFASSKRVERLSVATGLARCRMSEVELELLKKGYPLVDSSEEGDCCHSERYEGFRCSWSVERVLLPEAAGMDAVTSGEEGDSDSSGLGALGALAALGQGDTAALDKNADLGDVAQLMGGAAVGGTQSMAPLVMSLVYPSLKPMLEASIRKLKISVHWSEGSAKRDLSITQFVTSPQQGGFDPLAADGVNAGVPGMGTGTGTGTGMGTGTGIGTGTGTGTGTGSGPFGGPFGGPSPGRTGTGLP